MNNAPKKRQKEIQQLSSEQQELERMELLRAAAQVNGKQLQFDISSNELKEVDEWKEMIGKQFENPDDKYKAYYDGIHRVLKQYLPAGKRFKEARDLIYDEKNVFLNRGKKKSDNNGIRGSDGRMAFQPVMDEMVDLIIRWSVESRNPFTLYNTLFELNDRHGYGHEEYDGTSLNYANAMRRMKEYDA